MACLADRLLPLNQTALPCCCQLKTASVPRVSFSGMKKGTEKKRLNSPDCFSRSQDLTGPSAVKLTEDTLVWEVEVEVGGEGGLKK